MLYGIEFFFTKNENGIFGWNVHFIIYRANDEFA